jgi:hypothetical protein
VSHQLYYHFSVDDVFDVLLEASDSRDEPGSHCFLTYLSSLNRRFHTRVNLYLFLQKMQNGTLRSLADVMPTVGKWLRENSWVRLGPHGLDPETPPYKQSLADQRDTLARIYKHIDLLTGPAQYCQQARLHCFSESYELAPELKVRGVDTLFTTDKAAISYRLDDPHRHILEKTGTVDYAGLRLARSHLRIEAIAATDYDDHQLGEILYQVYCTTQCVVVFTHECELKCPRVQLAADRLLSCLSARGAIAQ